MRRFLYLSILFVLILSCKKEKLEGDAAILIGTWNWTETYRVSNGCDADSTWIYVKSDSASFSKSYSVEFLEKGKLIYHHNGGIINKNRIVFESKEKLLDSAYDFRFVLNLNNNASKEMIILVSQDSMLLEDFPKDNDGECVKIFNHFTK